MTRRNALYAVTCLAAIVATSVAAAFAFRPRPTLLSVSARRGDDTVVVNQIHPTRLRASVLDQYGRRVSADSNVRYRWMAGDSISISSDGRLQCDRNRDATVRAAFMRLSRDFVLRCRPVAWIEAPTWLDLVAGDSTRDLSFVAHSPGGAVVTELRGAVSVGDASVAGIEGTAVRPKRPGQTVAEVEIGDAKALIPIVVYQIVTSFAENPKKGASMAMRVSLARGDTIEVPLPKAAFWVTYFSSDRRVAPPTIELEGDGSCTTGDGVRLRRIEDGEYAKYCLAGSGARMMIAHGAAGAAKISGIVALRLMW